MKERYVMTELRKQANRIAFGKAEEQAEFMEKSKGLGMIGADTGHVRVAVADPRNRGT
jgi:U4/U6 small nuclear ribonucleoprotein PRP31